MALLQMNFYSDSLGQETCVNIILPDGKAEFKTLWLLHGLAGNHNSWIENSPVARYAADYGLCVVMPSGDRSWYTDTAYGKKYFTYITEELPKWMALAIKGYSKKREDNLVVGLSMGGYGALKMALTCPEKYCFCGSLSGSLDITRKGRAYNLDEWRAIFGFDIKSADELEGTKHDLFRLASECKNFPDIYLWCGTEDGLIEINKKFSALLTELGVTHKAEYSEGNHKWKWWDKHLPGTLKYWQECTAKLVDTRHS